MKLWSAFFDWVLPELPGCPQELVSSNLRSVAVDFLEKSCLYVVDHDPISLEEDESTYDLDSPNGYSVVRVTAAWHGSQRLDPATPEQLSASRANWQELTGAPAYYFQEAPDTIRLVPTPDAGAIASSESITLRTALRPRHDSEGIENWIFDSWVDVLADGAKGRLMVMPSKPWSNTELGAFYQQRYFAGLSRAKAVANNAMTRGPLRVSFRRFA